MVTLEVGDPDAPAPSEPVVSREECREELRVQFELTAVPDLDSGDDCEIDPVFAKLCREIDAKFFTDEEIHAGVASAKVGKRSWDVHGTGCLGHSAPYGAVQRRQRLLQRTAKALEFSQSALGGGDRFVTGSCQRDPACRVIDECEAELAFEFLDLASERGLRDM